MDLSAIIGTFTSIPTDWILIGILAIFAAFDALRNGSRRMCTLALALPLAALLFVTITDAAVLGNIVEQFSTPILEAVLFFILTVITYIVVSRIGLSFGGETGQTLQAALAGVAATAIVVVFWIQTPALDSLWHFGEQVQSIFGGGYRFWWLVGAYGALAFIRNS